jgi:hypothetical protein
VAAPAAAVALVTVKEVDAAKRSITVTGADGKVAEYAMRDDTKIQVGAGEDVRLDDLQSIYDGNLPIKVGQKLEIQSRSGPNNTKIATRIVIKG